MRLAKLCSASLLGVRPAIYDQNRLHRIRRLIGVSQCVFGPYNTYTERPSKVNAMPGSLAHVPPMTASSPRVDLGIGKTRTRENVSRSSLDVVAMNRCRGDRGAQRERCRSKQNTCGTQQNFHPKILQLNC